MSQPLLPEMEDPALQPVIRKLAHLAPNAPQTILLEGGKEAQRHACALYWAMAVNCPQARESTCHLPCLSCPTCKQIVANEYLDLFQFDGRISNREDEENPGPIRALSIENLRELKSIISVMPHGKGKRIVIFQGLLLSSRSNAMNSLLKNLEDPCGHTLFVLLAPQRSQLLNTLVSRSFCITLPWRDSGATDTEMRGWEDALSVFLRTGTEFLEKIAAKGAIDATGAQNLVLGVQRALGRCLGTGGGISGSLDKCLAPLAGNWKDAALVSRWIAEAQEMLAAGVNPARALEGFCAKLYVLLKTSSR